jgi:hypothetical protein
MLVHVLISSVWCFSVSICLVSHAIAQLLLTVITDVGSYPNHFCLMFSTRLCVVNHDIAQ